ncbi:CotH kinase family protein [Demequina oxidasica]|uniref:CotH kinase family protein n=1 Tax=Demequina oxidasica TaxID=676199 RepID=UPI0007858799|nr:CotH kinase family protein [Demequina oxidasica]
MNIRPRVLAAIAVTGISGVILAGCSTADPNSSGDSDGAMNAQTAADSSNSDAATPAVWDSTQMHTITIDYDESDYDALISSYMESSEKVWISATVTIDGETFENVGLKLKGNSSLRGLTEDADATVSAAHPEDLPWIIRLDKYVDDQSMDGATEFVVRGNSSGTSLNEAVALDLLADTGLAAEEAIAVSFSANGSDSSLRLVIENPNDAWMERELGDGYLWKAESPGTWDYIDEDPESYKEAFDQEGGEDNYEPLIDFLQFVNESDDETFGTDLDEWLDVDAFATYLAFQNVVNNFDDIDGPGNNSYLYWDTDTSQMTVVNWDLNLAFGQENIGGGGGQGGGPGGALPDADAEAGAAPGGKAGGGGERPDRGQAPDGATAPDGAALPDGAERPERPGTANGGQRPDGAQALGDAADAGAGQAGGANKGGGRGGSNILSERFLANTDFNALYETAVEDLTESLFTSGTAQEDLETWSELLTTDASDLVDPDVVATESQTLSDAFPL